MIERLIASVVAGIVMVGCQAESDPRASEPDPDILCLTRSDLEAPVPSLFHAYGLGAPVQCLSGSDLRALEMRTLRAAFPQGGSIEEWRGVPLMLVLRALEAEPGALVRLTALDGYQVDVSWEQIEAHQPVLAIERDQMPLTLGEYGPVMLIWPRQDDPELYQMTDDLWPWAVFSVEIVTQTPHRS